jgi:tetrahydromethanopterin S-methyltransferase subunit G
LEKDDVTSEDRKRIEDKMIEVAQMIGQKDSENKGFIFKIICIGLTLVTTFITFAAASLGLKTQISPEDDDEEDNDAA